MDTRSEIVTEQFMPALNSIKDTFEVDADGNTTLYFGPNPPEDESLPWIQTVPDANWFTYSVFMDQPNQHLITVGN